MLTETWREVPSDIDTPVLERAMADLTKFKTNAEYNHFYRSRLDYLRVQNTMAVGMAQVRAETEQARTNATYNHFYRSRLDYLRVQNTIAVSMAQVRAETEQIRAETAQALAREAQVLAREAKLRERLRAAGIDPDGV